jgi:hypothetical protein
MSNRTNVSEPAAADKENIPFDYDETNDGARPPKPSAAAKPDSDRLHVPLPDYADGIRSHSPDTLSNLSVDEINDLRRTRSPFDASSAIHSRHAGRSPGPSLSAWARMKGRLSRFWLRNKGLGLVLLSQVFGTLMNVTTRLLEVEGNNGKGMHPFQVRHPTMLDWTM